MVEGLRVGSVDLRVVVPCVVVGVVLSVCRVSKLSHKYYFDSFWEQKH